MPHAPIKRHQSLLWLSREHHHELLFCWKIRQGLRKNIDPDRIRNYVQYFWDAHLRHHIQSEEDILFSKDNGHVTTEAWQQYISLRNIIAALPLAKDNTSTLLSMLADKLDAHVRFEERTVFPELEQSLHEHELMEVGICLDALHETPFSEDYPDAFWVMTAA